MYSEIIKDVDTRMQKSVVSLEQELATVRTGRANTALVDHIKAECHGAMMPLNQVSSITVEDSTTLMISVWDAQVLPAVEKAIMESQLGLNPIVNGTIIRLKMPVMTEERRRDMVKLIGRYGEAARVAIRNIRRDANQRLKDAEKDKQLTQDEAQAGEKQVQERTKAHTDKIERLLAEKEKALMSF